MSIIEQSMSYIMHLPTMQFHKILCTYCACFLNIVYNLFKCIYLFPYFSPTENSNILIFCIAFHLWMWASSARGAT